jgi:hypothetical protein
MMITPEDAEMFKRHLNERVKAKPCPACDAEDWQIGGPVGTPSYEELPGRDPAGAVGTRGVFPLVFLMCGNCFYVRHFSLLAIRKERDARRAEALRRGGR